MSDDYANPMTMQTKLFGSMLTLAACLSSSEAAPAAKLPFWPFYRTYSWPPSRGVVVVFHQYRIFGRTTRMSHGHDSTPIRKKSYPYKVKKFWGWQTKRTIKLYNTRGTRISLVHYDRVGVDANRRIILTRLEGKKAVMVYIDSLGNTTPYDYPRR